MPSDTRRAGIGLIRFFAVAMTWVVVHFWGGAAEADNPLDFSSSDAGENKNIETLGINFGEIRISADTMGPALSEYGTFFDMRTITGGLNPDGTLTAAQMATIDSQSNFVLSRGQDVSIFLGASVGFSNTDDATHPSYLSGGGVNVQEWVRMMTATKNYWETKGLTISGVSPFVEPDFWPGQGTQTQLAQVMQLLRNDPTWKGVDIQAPSTLRAANAAAWYTPQIIGIADSGVTHLLDGPGEPGTMQTYDAFAQQVVASGNLFAAAELHSVAEGIVTANYNAHQAAWWGSTQRARGTLSYAVSPGGKRLGYEVDFPTQTAAAVYRAPDGQHYAFAGGPERTGVNNSFHINSTDRPMFVNGIGPIKTFSMQADSDRNTDDFAATFNAENGTTHNQGYLLGAFPSEGSMAVIDYGAPTSTPALDGHRWLIQNVANGQYLNVDGNSFADLANIRTSTNTGAAAQWDIKNFLHGYMELTNANSGRTLEVQNASVSNLGNVVQFGPTRNLNQQWYVQPAGDGTFYIKNANSTLVLDANLSDGNNVIQFAQNPNGHANQQWRFVEANPTRNARAQYNFAGNANNSGTGGAALNGTISGTAAYVAGPTAGSQALNFNGTDTFVTLPNAVTDSNTVGLHPLYHSGLTVNTWVRWDGGANFQRIFDFGTGTDDFLFLSPLTDAGTMRLEAAYGGFLKNQTIDTDPLAIGQWVNLSVTLGGNTAIIYVDGKPVAAGQMQFNPSLIKPTQSFIGDSQFAGDPLFDGLMSQFSIYDYALNATQIADILNDNLVWTGANNATWSVGGGNFSVIGGGASTYTQDGTLSQLNDRVTFDGTGGSNVNLSGVLSPFQVNVKGTTNRNFNGTGSIAGSTSLFKSGTSTLTINTNNSFTGGTFLSGGTIVMGNANALGTGFIDIVTGGTLTTTGYNGNAPTINNTIFATGGTVSAAANTTLSLAGSLGGDGDLTLTNGNSAQLRLTGNNADFAGNAIIDGSNVRIGSAGASSGQATWTVNTSLQLDAAGAANYSLGALAGNGNVGGRVANGGSTTSTLNVGGAARATDFGGVISNNLTGGSNNIIALNKVGEGTQILSGANTYTGATSINEGVLMLGNGGTTGSVSMSSPVSLNGGVLGFNRSDNLTQGTHFQNGLAGTGGLLQAGPGTVFLSGTNAYSGGTEITDGILSINSDASIGTNFSEIYLNGGTLQTTAFIDSTHPIIVDGIHGGTIQVTGDQLFLNNNNQLRGYGALNVIGNGTLTQGVGNLRLGQPNSYHGALVLEQGGILEYGTNGAIGANANNGLMTAAVWIADQGELAVQGNAAVSMNSAVHVTGNTNSVLSFENGNDGNVTSNISLKDGSLLTVGLRDWYAYGNSRSGTISGVISGAGGLVVNPDGSTGTGGTLTLSNNNTYDGGTTVNAGTLSLTAGGGNGTIRGELTINPGATVQLNAEDTLGFLTVGTNPVTQININGGTLNNNVAGNNSASASWTLTGGTMSSTGGGAFNIGFNAANNITSNASATQSTISGNVVLRSGNTPTITVADGAAVTDLLISGDISDNAFGEGAAGITKEGAGTLALTGANTFMGDTTINAGVVNVDGSIVSDVTVVAGLLGGNGTTGNVEVELNGSIGAGNSVGQLDVAGTLSLLGSMIVELEGGGVAGAGAGTDYDWIDVSGIATLGDGSTIDVNLLSNFGPVENSYFDVLTAMNINDSLGGNSLDGITFDYSDAMLASNLNWQASIVSLTGGGEALRLSVLTAIPEPGSYAVLGLGSLFLLRRRRRLHQGC